MIVFEDAIAVALLNTIAGMRMQISRLQRDVGIITITDLADMAIGLDLVGEVMIRIIMEQTGKAVHELNSILEQA